MTDRIQQATEELLRQLQIQGSVVVEKTTGEDAEHAYQVRIETAESGLLIGRHGETLNSLQLLLGVMLYKQEGIWIHVLIDVGNYRKMREESLTSMADRIAVEVEQTGQPVSLPYLSPLERRLVHMHLTTHQNVVSESVGEGKDRRLMIKPRSSPAA